MLITEALSVSGRDLWPLFMCVPAESMPRSIAALPPISQLFKDISSLSASLENGIPSAQPQMLCVSEHLKRPSMQTLISRPGLVAMELLGPPLLSLPSGQCV